MKGRAEIAVKGKKANEICDTIIRLGLISDVGHAMYIARELQKAEIALDTGRSYIQDQAVFQYSGKPPWLYF